MERDWARARWGQIAWAGLMAPLLSVFLVFLGLTVFALLAPGQVGPMQVSHVADALALWGLPGLVVALTELLAFRLARRGTLPAARYGILIGAIAGMTTCLLSVTTGGALDLPTALICVPAAAAGWVGSVTGSHMQLRPA